MLLLTGAGIDALGVKWWCWGGFATVWTAVAIRRFPKTLD